jgi:aryl-alcohol dehydrogenase-like predicted oxidoreductase
MRYKLLGKSGLRVSELCLGTMTFGEDWGWGSTKDESRKIYDAFLESGGNFIDTANVYTNGTSERFLGEFMSGHGAGLCWRQSTATPPPATTPTRPAISARA